MANDRRKFLKKMGLLGAGGTLLPSTMLRADPVPAKQNDAQAPSAENTFKLNILQTTDVHCQIFPHDELFWENNKPVFRKTGGYAHLSSFFKNERKRHAHTFIVDTGDMFQGSELSVKTTGKAMLPILNSLDYDLYLPGNWEVIYYKQAMQHLLGSLNGPKVCANMYHDKGDGTRGELIFLPYHIWTVNNIKIGFIGYTDPLVPVRQSPNYSKGIVYSKPEENLSHYVQVLRNQEGCAFVIMLAHLGLSQQISLANKPECEGVDYIFGGDTHERVRTPIRCRYSKVVEPGAFGSFAGKLELTVENGKITGDRYELLEIDAKKILPDPSVQAIIQNQESAFHAAIHRVLGYSTIPLYRYFVVENPIDTLILDALKWQFKDIDIVLSNGFRFCPPRTTRDQTGNIPITEGYLFDMLPVDSKVRTGKVTGKQIAEWLEKELNNVFAEKAEERFGGWVIKFKGMEISFKAFGPKGKRVQEISVAGIPLDAAKTYTICACERDGDPSDMLCRIKGVREAANTEYSLHEVMRNYLAVNSPVTPTPPGASKILDAPASLLTQVRGVDYQFR